jgi:hypothetical protein
LYLLTWPLLWLLHEQYYAEFLNDRAIHSWFGQRDVSSIPLQSEAYSRRRFGSSMQESNKSDGGIEESWASVSVEGAHLCKWDNAEWTDFTEQIPEASSLHTRNICT